MIKHKNNREKEYIVTPDVYKIYKKRVAASQKCTADNISITHFEGSEDSRTFDLRTNRAVLRNIITSRRGNGVVIVSDGDDQEI